MLGWRAVATAGAFPTVGSLPVFHGLAVTQTALESGSATMAGRPCAIRFVDSKGHSRFVLRILIIPSHRSRKTARVPASCLKPSVASIGAFSKRGPISRCSYGPHGLTQPALDLRLENPGATISGLTFATRLVDSKGHSRFVLRILIILSHWSRTARGGRCLLAGSRG